MPGTPVLRYGEEIGMGEDLSLRRAGGDPHPDAVGRRTATAASPTRTPAELVRPVPTRADSPTGTVNVRASSADPRLAAALVRAADRDAARVPGDRRRHLRVLDIPLPRSVLVHRFDAPEGSILLLHNLADRAGHRRPQRGGGHQGGVHSLRRCRLRATSPVVETTARQRMGVPLDQAASRRLAGGCGPAYVRAVPVGELPHQGTRRLECPEHLVGRRVL